MKLQPQIATLLYCQPWCILPESHSELGNLYRNYVNGTLAPQNLDGAKQVTSGIGYEVLERSGLAIVTVEGIIGKRIPDMMCGPKVADVARLDHILNDIAQDESIETLIIYFNTPGGSAIGLQETASVMQDVIDSGTRVVAYADVLCASAGYYLMAKCQEIYAAPSAMVGSIGTYIAALDSSRAFEMEGLKLKLFRDGELKAVGHPGKEWTEEEESHMQKMVEDFGQGFKNHVRSNRPAIEDSTMQGQCFSAGSAPKGLVDGLFRDVESLVGSEIEKIYSK